jgi:hypothetical protein
MISILLIIGCVLSISILAGFGWFVWYSEEAKRKALEASIEENERISFESSRKLKTFTNKINIARDDLIQAQESLEKAKDSGNKLKELQAKKDIEESKKIVELTEKLQEEAKANEEKSNEILRINILQQEAKANEEKSNELLRINILQRSEPKDALETYTFKTKKETIGNGHAKYLDRHDIKCSDKKILNGFVLKTSGEDIYYDYNCISSGEFDLNKFGIEKKTVSEPLNSVKYLDRHDVNCGSDSVMSRAKLYNKNGKWNYDYTCSENRSPLTCRKLSTSLNDNGANGKKSQFLDRHQIKCNSDEGLNQFTLVNVGNKYRYDYTCCSQNSTSRTPSSPRIGLPSKSSRTPSSPRIGLPSKSSRTPSSPRIGLPSIKNTFKSSSSPSTPSRPRFGLPFNPFSRR